MSEQMKMDAERAAFEAAYNEAVDDGWTSTKVLARKVWNKAQASLPAGVPDRLFLGDALLMWNRRHDNPPIKVGYEYGVADALLQIMAAPAAPTVKAEQVQCATCHGSGMVDDGEITCSVPFENGPVKCVKDCPDCAAPSLPAAAPEVTHMGGYDFVDASLPAAGSADVGKFSVQCGVCKESSTLDDRKELSGCCWACGHEIDLDSQLRAALSAQQSAPERVSVPVELLRSVCSNLPEKMKPARRELRALLASHGRGEA